MNQFGRMDIDIHVCFITNMEMEMPAHLFVLNTYTAGQ